MFKIIVGVMCVSWLAGLMLQGQPPASPKKAHEVVDCSKACDDCARRCEACSAHCGHKLAEGKKEHLTTHRTCADCATVCRSASSITARHGPFSTLICQACADACKECGDVCEKLKDDPMMKDCMDECRKCERACRDMLKTSTPAEKK